LGDQDSAVLLFWANDGLGDQLSEEGKLVEGLLTTWTNLLELAPDVRPTIGLRALKTNVSWGFSVSQLHAELAITAAGPVTDCDRLASFPYDPYRVAKGIDEIEDPALAITKCQEAVAAYPSEPRYIYLRGRAYARAGELANAQEEQAHSFELALDDYRAAMASGYPAAFHDMAIAYEHGSGVKMDEDKAADLTLEMLNRVLHCCWVPVARHLLEQRDKHDKAQLRQVVAELSRWSATLGSGPARALLAELTTNGTLPAGTAPDSEARFTDLPPWFRQ
jgi:hypothetical protein